MFFDKSAFIQCGRSLVNTDVSELIADSGISLNNRIILLRIFLLRIDGAGATHFCPLRRNIVSLLL